MTKKIGASEAKTKLSQLLDEAEAGQEIIIMHHGREAARLVPPRQSADRARDAAQRIRAMSKGVTLGGLTIKQMITEGRL